MNTSTQPAQVAKPAHSAFPPAPRRLFRLTVGVALRRADAVAGRWLAGRLGVASVEDLAARLAADAYERGADRGFEQGLAVGCALGRRLEALHREGEVARWRRLARWTARQHWAA